MQSLKLTHWVIIVVAVASVIYTGLYFTKAEATYSHTVGNISVKLFPNAGEGRESVVLSFSGIFGQNSTADLNGWTIMNNTGFAHDISEVELTNVESVKLCEDTGEVDPTCDYYWIGSDVFDDAGDALHVVADDQSTVLSITYNTSSPGVSLSGDGDYKADVYTPGDKITVCEMQKNGNMKLSRANTQKLTRNIDQDISSGNDIIPAFVYERDKSLGYHPGVNWPEDRDVLLNDCQ